MSHFKTRNLIGICLVSQILSCKTTSNLPIDATRTWDYVEPQNTCTKRHECAAVSINNQPLTPPLELHNR